MPLLTIPTLKVDYDTPEAVKSDVKRLWADHCYYLKKGSAFFWYYEDQVDGGVSECVSRYPEIYKYLNDNGCRDGDAVIVYDW